MIKTINCLNLNPNKLVVIRINQKYYKYVSIKNQITDLFMYFVKYYYEYIFILSIKI